MKRAVIGMVASMGLFAAASAFAGGDDCRDCGEGGAGAHASLGHLHRGTGGAHGAHMAAPEIDARTGLQAIVLIGGILLLMGDRFRRPR